MHLVWRKLDLSWSSLVSKPSRSIFYPFPAVPVLGKCDPFFFCNFDCHAVFRNELLAIQDWMTRGSRGRFDTSFGLTLRRWEVLEVFVNGEGPVDPATFAASSPLTLTQPRPLLTPALGEGVIQIDTQLEEILSSFGSRLRTLGGSPLLSFRR
jgi:hypothetical protein